MKPLMGNSFSLDKYRPIFLPLQVKHSPIIREREREMLSSTFWGKSDRITVIRAARGKEGDSESNEHGPSVFLSFSFSSRQPTHLSTVRGTNRAAIAATRNIPEATRYTACFRHSFPFPFLWLSLPFLFFFLFSRTTTPLPALSLLPRGSCVWVD